MQKQASPDPLSLPWPADWSVGVRIAIERSGKAVVDGALADLLAALDRTHSISGAARAVGISYRHAWVLLQRAGQYAGQPLVETAIGGKRGGGAQLTERGRAALWVFGQLQEQVRPSAAQTLRRLVAAGSPDSTTLHVAAAISLQEVVAQVLGEYALARPAVAVRTVFGSSNELADQFVTGNQADVFLSAHGRHIDRLAKAGLIARGTRTKLATNGLAVIGDPALVGQINKLTDLRKLEAKSLVLADPACPLGQCTAELLRSEKLPPQSWQGAQFTDNSRAVVASLRKGGRVGIVFGSDVANASELALLLQLPTTKAHTVYEGAVLATSTAPEEATELLKFFRSRTAQQCFRRCGFSK